MWECGWWGEVGDGLPVQYWKYRHLCNFDEERERAFFWVLVARGSRTPFVAFWV